MNDDNKKDEVTQSAPTSATSPDQSHLLDVDLIQTLEHLEAALIHALTANVDAIAPSSRSSLISLAHSLTCAALDKARASSRP